MEESDKAVAMCVHVKSNSTKGDIVRQVRHLFIQNMAPLKVLLLEDSDLRYILRWVASICGDGKLVNSLFSLMVHGGTCIDAVYTPGVLDYSFAPLPGMIGTKCRLRRYKVVLKSLNGTPGNEEEMTLLMHVYIQRSCD